MTREELVYRTNKGDILPGLIWVHDNPMDIPQRLKEIDPGYFVMFNPGTQKYEIHHEDQDFTLCVTLPYGELDSRALDYARETRIERFHIIKRQMEEKNRKIEESSQRLMEDGIEQYAKDIHKYALRHTDDDGRIN